MRNLIPLLLALSWASTAASEPPAPLTSDDDKTIYLMGLSLGRNIVHFDFDEREIAIVQRGLADSLSGREPAVDPAVYGPQMNVFMEKRNARTAAAEKVVSERMLAEAAKEPGAVKTESGLIYAERSAGSGPRPSATDKVKVHYHGTRADGSVFDSSRDRGEPVSFALNGVIPCWTEALQRMQVGAKALVVCPAEIAYGDRGFRGIKPGAALRFEVELLAIE